MRPFDPRLLSAAPPLRRPLAALAALGLAAGVSAVATVFAVSALVVAVVEPGPDRAAGTAPAGPAVAILAAFAMRAAVAALTERVAASAGVTASSTLRARLARRWAHAGADERPAPAQALTLLTSGASSVEPYVARFLPALVSAAVIPVLAVGTLFLVDWPSAVVVVLTLPLLPVFAALIGKATQERTEQRWGALSRLAGHFLDVVRGLPTLVTYGRAERQVEAVREVSERHRTATMSTLRIAFLSSAALELLATISVAIVAVTVGLRLTWGTMELGTALVAILLAPEAYWPVRRVGQEFHAAADGAVALEQILTALATTPTPDAAEPAPSPTAGTVLVHEVSYRHGSGDPLVLDRVSLVAGPGLTVVTGPSGVGKSTLLELVAGLRHPVSGEIRCGATHLVTQRPFLSAPTVRENLTMGGDHADEVLWAALREVGMDGTVAALPLGLSAPLGEAGFGLSAGQRQRLALARAWLSTEPVLLLDEPTAHLDDASAEVAHTVIARLAQRRTVIVVTHRPELVSLSDQHLHLSASTAPRTSHVSTAASHAGAGERA